MEREKFIESYDGTRLYTAVSGSGEPILLCDGLGCDGYIWRYIREGLASRYQVVRWHYRGHGHSAAPPGLDAIGIEPLRKDLLAVMDAHGLERAAVLGHSLGVQVALDFALEHPERVSALATLCGSYGTPLRTFHGNGRLGLVFPYIQQLVEQFPERAQWVWSKLLTTELTYQVASRLEVNGKIVRRRDFEPYFRHLAGMDVRVFVRLLEDASRHSVEDRLGEVAQPVLVVGGDRDTFTPGWLSQRMHALIPNAEILMIPGGSHIAPLEIPELVQLRLERFLETHLGAGRAAAPAAAPTRRRRPRAPIEA
jgi:pimeloyl-ACP methyl ester carboxylesterase